MPSYRTIMTVTTLAPGRAPEEVEAAARSVTRLESWDIAIASGQPRVTARFTATDDAEARAIHREITAAVRLVADVPRARLAAVVRGRSHYLAPRVHPPAWAAPASSQRGSGVHPRGVAHSKRP